MRYSKENHVGKILFRGDVIKLKRRGKESSCIKFERFLLGFLCSIISNSPGFIQDYESEDKFSIPDDRISHLLPTSYQDMIVRVYSKKPELVCKPKC